MKIGNLEVYGVIYKVKNKINNKHYIGQTIRYNGFNDRYKYKGNGIERVYNHYIANKRNKRYFNDHLFKSIRKYGFNAFEISEIFDIAFSKEKLDIKEQMWISIYKSNDRMYGYNIDNGGNTGVSIQGYWTGKHLSEVHKNKLSDLAKGRRHSPKTLEKLKKIRKGRTPNTSKVICLNNLELFNTIKDAKLKYNCFNISACCNGKVKSCGRDKNGIPLVWMYYEDYLKSNDITIKNKLNNSIKINRDYENISGVNNYNSKKVICLTTNKIFNTAIEASKYYKCNNISIGQCCKGKYKSSGKLSEGIPLKWMYYDEYIKQNKLLIHNKNLEQAI